MIKVEVQGSCISRVFFSRFTEKEKNEIKVNKFLDKQNIVSSMMPVPNLPMDEENLWGGIMDIGEFERRNLKIALEKSTLDRLLISENKYLFIDFYDLCIEVAVYNNTTFSTYEGLFYKTENYKKNSAEISRLCFLEIPTELWYGYVDLYFKFLSCKFPKIIVNRVQCCDKYISKKHHIGSILEDYNKSGFPHNYKYNESLRKIEEYIINKYNVIVFDYTKYFISDESVITPKGVHSVHYEEEYYQILKYITQSVILGGNENKTHSDLPNNIISIILRHELSNDEYLNYHHAKLSPFFSFGILNAMFIDIKDDDLLENRLYIAEIYDSLKMEFVDKEFYEIENWKKFISQHEKLFLKSEYLQNIFSMANDNIEYIKSLNESECVQLITELIEDNNLLWVFALNVSYCKYKNSKEINNYIEGFRNFTR